MILFNVNPLRSKPIFSGKRDIYMARLYKLVSL